MRLADLANVARISVTHFLTANSSGGFGCAPPVYVIQRRLARAQNFSGKDATFDQGSRSHSGFADQSHMTRAFQKYLRYHSGRLSKRNRLVTRAASVWMDSS